MVGNISGNRSNGLIINSLSNVRKNQESLFKTIAKGEKAFSQDAASASIAEKLSAIDTVLGQGTRNVRQAVSLADVKEAANDQIGNLLDRRSELAAQASNGTLGDTERAALDAEFQQLGEEIQRIQATTEINGVNPFEDDVTVQVGSDSSENSQLTISSTSFEFSNSDNILTADAARSALDSTSSQRDELSASRAQDGATFNRLQTAAESNESTRLALQEAESRLRDPNLAQAAADLTRNNILADTNTALLAQANNQDKQTVLNLLR